LGSKSIIFNPEFLKSYLYDTLAFWRAERSPRGVEVNDAWKCRICDFRAGCEWIHKRDELRVKEAEERKKMREAAGVEGGGNDAEEVSKGSRRSRV
jgi:exonuclease V